MMSLLDREAATMVWGLIRLERDAWRRAGQTPTFWWRDDDARRPSAGLERLIGLAKAYGRPVALAVIPDGDLSALEAALRGHEIVRVIQHGCDHVDRNKDGEFSAEFHPSAAPDDIAARINSGWGRLREMTNATPVYAPPWNRLTANARAALSKTPLRAVSLYGAENCSDDQLIEINAHVDIMRWRPAGFRGSASTLSRIWKQMRARRRSARWQEPIGILTHHKNLDDRAWNFLESFLDRTRHDQGLFQWRSIDELVVSSLNRRTPVIPAHLEFDSRLPSPPDRLGRA